MGGKKRQQNEFYFFMIHKKPEFEKRLGRTVTMQELPGMLYAEWKNLPAREKQKYKEMRDKHRETAEKLDCRGIPLSELKRREEGEKQKIEEMKRNIGNAIDFHKTGGALHHLTIYIVSTSYYVRTDEDDYTPAELSVAQFNFNQGIIRELHVIFKPDIPTGYRFVAQEHSEATHNLLDENNAGVDINDALVDVIHFVQKENDQVPPLYTLDENREFTEALLETIIGEDYFQVYSLQYFFQNMYCAALQKDQLPQSIATDMLTHCGLDFHPAMACEWHRNFKPDSGRHCTQSCIRRWMFNMCDNMLLSKTFGVEPRESKHLPRAVPAYGVLVDVPRPVFRDDRSGNAASQGSGASAGGKSGNTSFSFSPKSKPQGAMASPSTPASNSWSSPTSPEPLQPYRKPAQNAWSRAVSTPSAGPSRSSSMASVCSSRIDATSEEDFPALGAGVARRAPTAGSSTSLASAGRGVMRNPNSQSQENQSARMQLGMGRGILRNKLPAGGDMQSK